MKNENFSKTRSPYKQKTSQRNTIWKNRTCWWAKWNFRNFLLCVVSSPPSENDGYDKNVSLWVIRWISNNRRRIPTKICPFVWFSPIYDDIFSVINIFRETVYEFAERETEWFFSTKMTEEKITFHASPASIDSILRLLIPICF